MCVSMSVYVYESVSMFIWTQGWTKLHRWRAQSSIRLPSLHVTATGLGVLRATFISDHLASNSEVPMDSLRFNNWLERLTELRKVP